MLNVEYNFEKSNPTNTKQRLLVKQVRNYFSMICLGIEIRGRLETKNANID